MKHKKHILKLLIVLVLLPVIGSAQQYHPFPEENAVWTEQNLYLESYPPVSWTSLYIPEQDTIIKNKLYRIVFEFTLSSTTFDTIKKRYAYIRQDTIAKKVYIIREYLNENIENLLMNYSVQVGDTVNLDAYYWDLFPNETDSIYITDSISYTHLFDGESRKIFYLSNHRLYFPVKLTFIEGIGSIGFPFGPTSNWINKHFQTSSELCCPDSLLCLSVQDKYLYVKNDSSHCGKLEVWTDIQSTSDNPQFSIYPNPTNDKVNITLDNSDNSQIVTIFNLYGKEMFSSMVNQGKLIINLESYPSGIYIISAKNQKFIKSFKLIKN